MRGTELREDHPRSQYSYSHPSYPDTDMQTDGPHSPSSTPAPSQNHYHPQREPNNISHRRSFTTQYPLPQVMSHLSSPAHLHHPTVRQPEPHRVHDSALHAYRMAYGPDGRLNSLP